VGRNTSSSRTIIGGPNFIRAARIRTEQIRTTAPDAKITWLVYRPGYKDRGVQEKQDLFAFIDSVREKFDLKLVYFDKGNEVINYSTTASRATASRSSTSSTSGHSNAEVLHVRLQQQHRERLQIVAARG